MLAGLLFVSGASALVFQALWVRTLGLVVGVEVEAASAVVSAFFAGLALGSRWLGARADRSLRPLRFYAALEIGSGLLGVATTLLLSTSAPWFVALRGAAGSLAWLPLLIAIAVPATLMGGTVPALLRAARPSDAELGSSSGVLYAANTAGAIVGALSPSFWLLPALGARGTAFAAGIANLAVAAVAVWLSRSTTSDVRRAGAEAASPDFERSEPAPPAVGSKLALLLYAVTGGLALGLEILWTHAFVQFLSTRAYAFAIVLATYLTGLALGSYACGRSIDRAKAPWAAFGLLIAGAGVTSVLSLALLGSWLSSGQEALGSAVLAATESRMAMMCARFTLASATLVLIPTLFLGAAYPAAIRLVARAATLGSDSGRVAAINTAGGIVGSLLAAFVLLPTLGLVRSLGLLGLLLAGLGLLALSYGHASTRARALAGGLVAVCLLSVVLVPRDKLARLLSEERGGKVVFYEEGSSGTVAVLEQRSARTSFRRLYIQGVSNTGDAMPSLRYMRLQAFLPLLFAPSPPRSALVIGLGTGITCGSLAVWPTLERRVCVELSPAVARASSMFQGNFAPTRDERFEIRIADGRHAMLTSRERYDVITLEPPPPAAAGVVNLYSRDFYELARARLSENGALAQWWPIATQNDEDSRSLVQSMLEIFPNVALFTTELHEMLLLGSMRPLRFDLAALQAQLTEPALQQALTDVGITSIEELLATYVTDRSGLEGYVSGAPPVTDDDPRIEYAPWVRPNELTRVLPKLLERAIFPPITGERAAMLAPRMEAKRQELYDFYLAGVSAMTGDRATWSQALHDVGPALRENAYYAWFAGEAAPHQ